MTRKWTEILIHHSATEGRSMRTWQAIRRDHGERLAALEASHTALLRGQERQENALQEVDRKVGELLRYLVPHRDRG